MASIVKRLNQDGKVVYFVRIRRKGSPPQIATFPRLADAKKWAQTTEGAILEGRHFPTTASKRHTISELLERYRSDVLPVVLKYSADCTRLKELELDIY